MICKVIAGLGLGSAPSLPATGLGRCSAPGFLLRALPAARPHAAGIFSACNAIILVRSRLKAAAKPWPSGRRGHTGRVAQHLDLLEPGDRSSIDTGSLERHRRAAPASPSPRAIHPIAPVGSARRGFFSWCTTPSAPGQVCALRGYCRARLNSNRSSVGSTRPGLRAAISVSKTTIESARTLTLAAT
jgi:hypothetical protein